MIQYSRRDFCKSLGAATLATGACGFPYIASGAEIPRKIMVMGVDGMDPGLLQLYMRKGWMPNCSRLARMGAFSQLQSSDPPQSPVAWSNFISGTNPGGHGIFDFISRDAETLKPFLSTSKTMSPAKSVRLGKYSLPLSSAKVDLLREGPTLWNILQDEGITSKAIKAPVNFPASECKAQSIAGITTPDIHGSYGIFSFYSESPRTVTRDVPGGEIQRIRVRDGVAQAVLKGPVNSFRTDGQTVDVPFTVSLNAERTKAHVVLQDTQLLLKEGEWSNWVTLSFPMLPMLAEVTGICRVYVKQTRPHLEVYISPINIDPKNPTMPLSSPESYASELARNVGDYYTQGMPEDTAALSSGVFSDEDYRSQATYVLEERLRLLDFELNRYSDGFFYFYFSSLDLDSHMFWRTIDPEHPLYTKELAARHGDFLPWLYRRIDGAIGQAMEHMDDRTLFFVVSDHGFVPFRRQFNLNSWLMDHGYAKPKNRFSRGHTSFFQDTDWRETSAYGLGINSLYLNVAGREPDGTVQRGQAYEGLRDELITRLKSVRDPENGQPVMSNVFKPESIYSGPYLDRAPDLIVCYNKNYRASWDTILGKYPREHILDNLDPWSGDHCMDKQFLPGVLLSNKGVAQDRTIGLHDMAPTILQSCRITLPAEMSGQSILV